MGFFRHLRSLEKWLAFRECRPDGIKWLSFPGFAGTGFPHLVDKFKNRAIQKPFHQIVVASPARLVVGHGEPGPIIRPLEPEIRLSHDLAVHVLGKIETSTGMDDCPDNKRLRNRPLGN